VKPEAFLYDSAQADETVQAVRDRLPPDTRTLDVGGEATHREATIALKQAVRIGSPPDRLYDDGILDFGPGVLITVAPTGRKELHVGEAALDALRELDAA